MYVKLKNYNVDSKNNTYLFFHFTAAGIGLLTFDRTNYVRDRVLSLLDVDNKIIVKCIVIWKIFSKNLKFKYKLFRCIKRFIYFQRVCFNILFENITTQNRQMLCCQRSEFLRPFLCLRMFHCLYKCTPKQNTKNYFRINYT